MKRRFTHYKNQKYATAIPDIERQLHSKVEGDTTIITMYGIIGSYEEEISAMQVVNLLDQVDTPNITVRLNSPGGESDQGIAIYNRLKDHDSKVKIIVDGWACSAGGLICMAADELFMNTGTLFMAHEAWGVLVGNKSDLKNHIQVMDKLDQAQVDIFMTKAKVSREEMTTLLENETWFTANEAVSIGFASEVKDFKTVSKMDSETYKASILTRFQKAEPAPPAASTTTNMLDRFKRAD